MDFIKLSFLSASLKHKYMVSTIRKPSKEGCAEQLKLYIVYTYTHTNPHPYFLYIYINISVCTHTCMQMNTVSPQPATIHWSQPHILAELPLLHGRHPPETWKKLAVGKIKHNFEESSRAPLFLLPTPCN